MAKRKSSFDFEDWLIAGGLILLFYHAFKTPRYAAISGIPSANRKLIIYTKADGTRVLDNEMSKLDQNKAGEVIRLIIEARVSPLLQMPLYKEFKNSDICEFRSSKWRLLCAKLANGDYVMVSFFKKQSNATPLNEILKANRRIKEYFDR